MVAERTSKEVEMRATTDMYSGNNRDSRDSTTVRKTATGGTTAAHTTTRASGAASNSI
jgi:hypothetical protein